MAVTKVTQSFKEKLPNGGWGEEVKLSTISDLIFYSDGKNLTTKTSELSDKIDTEIQDRKDAVSDEATTRASEITRIEGLISSTEKDIEANVKSITEINETTIPNAVSVANDYADELVAPIIEIIGNMEDIKGDPLSEVYPLTISEKIKQIDAILLSILDRLTELEK